MDDRAAATEVDSALRRVAGRLRLSSLIDAGVYGLLAAIAMDTMLVVGERLGAIPMLPTVIAAVGVVFAVALALFAVVRPVASTEAARVADAALGLSDRLGSAHAFLADPAPSPLMQAAIRDAARVASDVNPARVVQLALPRATWALPAGLALLVAALLVHLPHRAVVEQNPPERSRFVVEPDALAAERAAVHRMGREARGKDAELAALAEQLDALLAAVDQQKLTRAQVFEQLAKLEAEHAKPSAEALKPSEQLRPATDALSKSKQTQKLAEALKHDDLSAAKAELEKLAAEAEKRGDTSAEEKAAQKELARAMESASAALAEAQKKHDQARDQKMDQLKEEERRLKKQKEEHPDDEETERRLQKNKRELERLEKEKQEEQEQRRQLQRLQKDMQDAAEQLRQKMSPEAMKRAAEELGKMEDEIKKLGSSAQAQMQIAQIKEVLRRAGRVEKGDGGDGQGQQGQGKQGKNGRGEKLQSFDKRAGGKGDTLLLGGDGTGDTQLLLPMPGPGESGSGPGDKGGDKPGGDDPGKNGDGIGDQHDPNMQGDATKLAAAKKTIHAKGQAGSGPSRSQTILGASDKGFASGAYHQVYDDYSSVVEEVMSQEKVPPGYRYYVKRYFQLIRPRE